MYVLKPEFLSKSVFSADCRGNRPSWCIDGLGSEWSPSLSAGDVLVIHASQIFSTGGRIWIKVSGWFSDKAAAVLMTSALSRSVKILWQALPTERHPPRALAASEHSFVRGQRLGDVTFGEFLVSVYFFRDTQTHATIGARGKPRR